MKKKFFSKTKPPEFKRSKKLVAAGDTSLEYSLNGLRRALERQKSESERAIDPGFGRISRDERDQFNLRHEAEHMSFIVQGETS